MRTKKRETSQVREDRYEKVFLKVLPRVYFIILFVMLGMLLFNRITCEKDDVGFGLNSYQSVTDDLFQENGEKFELDKIHTYKMDQDGMVSMFYRIPGDLVKDETILFRSENAYVKAYLDGIICYETDMKKGRFYNRSPGIRWNFITIDDKDASKILEVKIKPAYKDGRAKVDLFFFGDRATMIINFIKIKGLAVFFCILMYVVGIIYLITNYILNQYQQEKDLSLFYLGLFAMISSLWALIETNIFQFFIHDVQFLQLLSSMLLVAGPIPLFMYMEEVYHLFQYRVIRVLGAINVLYLVFSTVAQLLELRDYHQMLNLVLMNYAVILITMIGCVIREAVKNRRSKGKNDKYVDYIMQQSGMITLWFAITIDYCRYLLYDVMDRALVTRGGLVIFVIFLGIGTMYRLTQLVKQGRDSELISRLAYHDGLTNVGNRTAYTERLDALAQQIARESCGIILFDINNLKRANDSFGHQYGDILIKDAAEIIQRSFGRVGEIYRIGGDEFTCLIVNNHPEESYTTAIERFHLLIEESNRDREFPISIAHGKAYCRTLTRENLKLSEKDADADMYRNKAEMKKQEADAKL